MMLQRLSAGMVEQVNPDGSKTIFPSTALRASVGGVYEETRNSLNAVTRTVVYYSAGGAMRVTEGAESHVYYMLKDHLGSASVVTDSLGNIVDEQRYMPPVPRSTPQGCEVVFGQPAPGERGPAHRPPVHRPAESAVAGIDGFSRIVPAKYPKGEGGSTPKRSGAGKARMYSPSLGRFRAAPRSEAEWASSRIRSCRIRWIHRV